MNIKSFVFLCILVLIGQSALAQTPLRGEVVDATSGAPIGFPKLWWLGTDQGVEGDEAGKFELPRTPESDQLVIKVLGSLSDTLFIEDYIEDLRIEFQLPAEETELEEVKITTRQKSSAFSRLDPFGVELMRESELTKAACCNLSESFETNPSVDVAYPDAVTGEKRIKMLGLDGQYVTTTLENMPLLSGMAAVNGYSFVPGPWVKGIQISKGAGTVVNGFESIAGQINVAFRDPFDEERLYLNGYVNAMGRTEGNAIGNIRVGKKWATNLLLHGSTLQSLNDRNEDGFLDTPLRQTFTGMNRWKYESGNGLCMQFNVSGIYKRDEGGQVNYYSEDPVIGIPFYAFNSEIRRLQAFAKVGYFDPKDPLKSVGSQFMVLHHQSRSTYGARSHQGLQQSAYANLIGQLPLGGPQHLIKTGFSFVMDDYRDSLRISAIDSQAYDRREVVPGLFAEYTFSPSPKMDLVLGLRSDLHNYYGTFYTPRLNFRYSFTESTIFRLAAGRGQRSPNLLSDQHTLLASSRQVLFSGRSNLPGYGYQPEIGWNVGGSLMQYFFLDYREGSVRAEYYHTRFTQQIVVDRETPGLLEFYPLNGTSFAHSFLVEGSYELVKRLDVRLAYRYYLVRRNYRNGQLDVPFNPRHRGFLNLAYRTRKGGWSFDYTWQAIGPQRVPSAESSPAYSLMSGQVSKTFGKRWELYLGGENLTNFRQPNPIIAPDQPFGQDFDATMVWAPVFGRNVYAGFRYIVRKKG